VGAELVVAEAAQVVAAGQLYLYRILAVQCAKRTGGADRGAVIHSGCHPPPASADPAMKPREGRGAQEVGPVDHQGLMGA
jgi:hypothetical protein